MKFKGIIFDLDNTLYEYDPAHLHGMSFVKDEIKKFIDYDNIAFDDLFKLVKKEVKETLGKTASSHNRLIYFQLLCEKLEIKSFPTAMNLYNAYWDNFLDKVIFFPHAEDVLTELSKDFKLIICTDLTSHIQYRKIEKLKLEKYFDFIVTSEDTGHDKPHPSMFNTSLKKLQLSENEVCMIGDNYKKDIIGATDLGIQSFWYTQGGSSDLALVQTYSTFKELRDLIYE